MEELGRRAGEEVGRRVADELNRSMPEILRRVNERVAESDRRMRESDRRMRESDRRMRESDRRMRESAAELVGVAQELQSNLGKRPSSEADHEDAPGREERLRLVREADIQKRLVDLYREQLEKERSLALQERDQAQCVLEHVQKELKDAWDKLKDAQDKLNDAHVLCAGAQFASNEWRRLCGEAQKERDELQKSVWQLRGRDLDDLAEAQLESLLEDNLLAKERIEKMQLRRAAEARVLAKHPDYACPISLAIMRDPVVTDDGQSYERTEIEAWFKAQREANEPLTSPLRAPLKSAQLVPNHSLRRAIEAAVEAELGA